MPHATGPLPSGPMRGAAGRLTSGSTSCRLTVVGGRDGTRALTVLIEVSLDWEAVIDGRTGTLAFQLTPGALPDKQTLIAQRSDVGQGLLLREPRLRHTWVARSP